VELDPENEEARVCLAVALLASHDDPDAREAVKHFEFVRQRQPDNVSVLLGLAECRIALGKPDEAVMLADQVLAQRPDYPPALSLRGRIAFNQGEYEAAENWLRQSLDGEPSNYVARYLLVLCLDRNGKREEAREQERLKDQIQGDLQRCDEIVTRDLLKTPHDPALHCELGQLLLRLGRRDEGLRRLESALREDPNYAQARKALADYEKKSQTKE
jgi:predicted Zn-dependent protease